MNYEKILSDWLGFRVSSTDDFDVVCECDFDFIEILMLFEKEFSFNLLDTTKVRQDFLKVDDFISWAASRPRVEDSFIRFRLDKPEFEILIKH